MFKLHRQKWSTFQVDWRNILRNSLAKLFRYMQNNIIHVVAGGAVCILRCYGIHLNMSWALCIIPLCVSCLELCLEPKIWVIVYVSGVCDYRYHMKTCNEIWIRDFCLTFSVAVAPTCLYSTVYDQKSSAVSVFFFISRFSDLIALNARAVCAFSMYQRYQHFCYLPNKCLPPVKSTETPHSLNGLQIVHNCRWFTGNHEFSHFS